jgi:hypothetical protein
MNIKLKSIYIYIYMCVYMCIYIYVYITDVYIGSWEKTIHKHACIYIYKVKQAPALAHQDPQSSAKEMLCVHVISKMIAPSTSAMPGWVWIPYERVKAITLAAKAMYIGNLEIYHFGIWIGNMNKLKWRRIQQVFPPTLHRYILIMSSFSVPIMNV